MGTGAFQDQVDILVRAQGGAQLQKLGQQMAQFQNQAIKLARIPLFELGGKFQSAFGKIDAVLNKNNQKMAFARSEIDRLGTAIQKMGLKGGGNFEEIARELEGLVVLFERLGSSDSFRREMNVSESAANRMAGTMRVLRDEFQKIKTVQDDFALSAGRSKQATIDNANATKAKAASDKAAAAATTQATNEANKQATALMKVAAIRDSTAQRAQVAADKEVQGALKVAQAEEAGARKVINANVEKANARRTKGIANVAKEAGRQEALAAKEQARALKVAERATLDAAKAQAKLDASTRRTAKSMNQQTVALKQGANWMRGFENRTDAANLSLNVLSAAGAGFLSAMSLLQGSVIGVAFSLIFLKFAMIPVAVATAAAVIAIGSFVNALTKAITTAKSAGESLFRLTTLFGDMEAAAGALLVADRLAVRFGLDLDETRQAVEKMVASGIPGIEGFIPVFTDLAAAVGSPVTAMQILDQAIGKERGNLLALRQANIRVDEAMASVIDELDRENRVLAINEIVLGQVEGAAERLTKTLGGAMTRFATAFKLLFQALGAPIIEDILVPLINKLASFVDSLGVLAGNLVESEGFLRQWNQLLAAAKELLEALGLTSESTGDSIRDKFVSAILLTTRAATLLIIAITRLVLLIRAIGAALKFVLPFFKALIDGIRLVVAFIKELLDRLRAFKEDVLDIGALLESALIRALLRLAALLRGPILAGLALAGRGLRQLSRGFLLLGTFVGRSFLRLLSGARRGLGLLGEAGLAVGRNFRGLGKAITAPLRLVSATFSKFLGTVRGFADDVLREFNRGFRRRGLKIASKLILLPDEVTIDSRIFGKRLIDGLRAAFLEVRGRVGLAVERQFGNIFRSVKKFPRIVPRGLDDAIRELVATFSRLKRSLPGIARTITDFEATLARISQAGKNFVVDASATAKRLQIGLAKLVDPFIRFGIESRKLVRRSFKLFSEAFASRNLPEIRIPDRAIRLPAITIDSRTFIQRLDDGLRAAKIAVDGAMRRLVRAIDPFAQELKLRFNRVGTDLADDFGRVSTRLQGSISSLADDLARVFTGIGASIGEGLSRMGARIDTGRTALRTSLDALEVRLGAIDRFARSPAVLGFSEALEAITQRLSRGLSGITVPIKTFGLQIADDIGRAFNAFSRAFERVGALRVTVPELTFRFEGRNLGQRILNAFQESIRSFNFDLKIARVGVTITEIVTNVRTFVAKLRLNLAQVARSGTARLEIVVPKLAVKLEQIRVILPRSIGIEGFGKMVTNLGVRLGALFSRLPLGPFNLTNIKINVGKVSAALGKIGPALARALGVQVDRGLIGALARFNIIVFWEEFGVRAIKGAAALPSAIVAGLQKILLKIPIGVVKAIFSGPSRNLAVREISEGIGKMFGLAAQKGATLAARGLIRGLGGVVGALITELILQFGIAQLPISEALKEKLGSAVEQGITGAFLGFALGGPIGALVLLITGAIAGLFGIDLQNFIKDMVVGAFTGGWKDGLKLFGLVLFSIAFAVIAAALLILFGGPILIALGVGLIAFFVGALIIALIDKWHKGILGAFAKVGDFFVDGFNSIKNFVKNNWVRILIAGILLPLFPLFIAAVAAQIAFAFRDKIKGMFVSAFNAVKGFITDNWKTILIGMLLIAFGPATIIAGLAFLGVTILRQMSSTFDGLVSDLGDLGRQLWDSIKGGFFDAVSGSADFFADVGGKILKGFKSGFGLFSPSEEYIAIGKALIESIEQGVDENVAEKASAIATAVTEILTAIQSALDITPGSFDRLTDINLEPLTDFVTRLVGAMADAEADLDQDAAASLADKAGVVLGFINEAVESLGTITTASIPDFSAFATGGEDAEKPIAALRENISNIIIAMEEMATQLEGAAPIDEKAGEFADKAGSMLSLIGEASTSFTDLTPLTANIRDQVDAYVAFITGGDGIVQKFADAAAGINGSIADAESFATAADKIFDAIGGAADVVEKIKDLGIDLQDNFDKFEKHITSAIEVFANLQRDKVTQSLIPDAKKFLTSAKNVFRDIQQAAEAIVTLDQQGEIVKGAFTGLQTAVTEGAGILAATAAIAGPGGSIPRNWQRLLDNLETGLKTQGISVGPALISGIFQGARDFIRRGGPVALMNQTKNSIKDRFQNRVKDAGWGIGDDLIKGIIQGAKDYLNRGGAAAGLAEVARLLRQGLEDAVEGGSPAMLFAPLGESIAQGIELGILRGAKGVQDALNSIIPEGNLPLGLVGPSGGIVAANSQGGVLILNLQGSVIANDASIDQLARKVSEHTGRNLGRRVVFDTI